MDPGVIVILAVVVIAFAGLIYQLIFSDRAGALDDDKSGPTPLYGRRPPGDDSGRRRDHE
jgi:hypothetical protein